MLFSLNKNTLLIVLTVMKQLIVIIAVIFPLVLSGQPIEEGKVDRQLLADMLKERVDSLRAEKGLHALKRDKTLDKAAKDHAAYILKTGSFGHFQENNPKMRTPRQRIVHYGGDYRITAENVLQSFLLIPVMSFFEDLDYTKLDTYPKTAAELAEGWSTSPGHYRNIMMERFTHTGMAISYDPKTHIVYAVQVFGGEE